MTTDTQSCAKKGRGRPKVFDREAALDKAMTLFWQYGYEATSLSDLVEATGAKAPTLYAEFANKEGLFRAVLDHYITHFASKNEACLFCEEQTLVEALRNYFTAVATCFTSKDTPAGCFMINTSAALAASSTLPRTPRRSFTAAPLPPRASRPSARTASWSSPRRVLRRSSSTRWSRSPSPAITRGRPARRCSTLRRGRYSA